MDERSVSLPIKDKIINLTNGINRFLSVEATNLTDAIQLVLNNYGGEQKDIYFAYYLEYDVNKSSYQRVLIKQIEANDVIDLKDGVDVAEAHIGEPNYNPYLVFQEWSCPLEIDNNTVTIPSYISSDVYIGAVYIPSGGTSVYVDILGNVSNVKPSDGLVRVYMGNDLPIGTNTNGPEIPNSYLADCKQLEVITLPNTITRIGTSGLTNCSSLKYIIFPSSVVALGTHVMKGCLALTYVSPSSSLDHISSSQYQACRNLQSIVLPYQARELRGSSCFYDNSNLTHITLSPSLVSGGTSVFYNCNSITKLHLPSQLSILGLGALQRMTSLREVVVPQSMTELPNSLFYQCYNLYDVRLTENITQIGDGSFNDCHTLHTVGPLTNVVSIGSKSFALCTSVESLSFSSDLIHVGPSAFTEMYAMNVLDVENGLPEVPDGVCRKCSSLKEVILREGVESIGENAFWECMSLTQMICPHSLKVIGKGAFKSCSNLRKVELMENIESISEEAFADCGGLTSLIIHTATPPSLVDRNALSNCYSQMKIYVPSDSVDAYKNATNWVTYASMIFPITD